MITFKEGEKLLFTIRKHIFMFIADIAGLILLAFIPAVFFVLAGDFIDEYILDVVAIPFHPFLFVFGYALWLLLIWMRVYIIWTDYYLDCWFVTDKRIVDVEQNSFFNRNVSTISYDRIQDITIEVEGIIATHFNFGDLHVQSAGEAREFVIRGISHPYETKEKLARQRESFIRENLHSRTAT